MCSRGKCGHCATGEALDARNGNKKAKKKKPVVVKKNAKTVGLAADYEDEEVEVDSDYDDEDERDEE